MTLHRRGQLAEAEALYSSVLAEQPKQFEALLSLGLIRPQQRAAEAISMFSKAVGEVGLPEAGFMFCSFNVTTTISGEPMP